MYQGCYPSELLPILTAKWLETSSPKTGVNGMNPSGLKCDNQRRVCWLLDLSRVHYCMGLLMFLLRRGHIMSVRKIKLDKVRCYYVLKATF